MFNIVVHEVTRNIVTILRAICYRSTLKQIFNRKKFQETLEHLKLSLTAPKLFMIKFNFLIIFLNFKKGGDGQFAEEKLIPTLEKIKTIIFA